MAKDKVVKQEGWGMGALTPKAVKKTASQRGYYVRWVKDKFGIARRQIVKYVRKPKATEIKKVGGRERRIYSGEAKAQLEEFARAHPNTGKIDWSGEQDGNFLIESVYLRDGVVRFAERYADSEMLERIRNMKAEVLQTIYNEGNIVFEVYFQYTNVGYDPVMETWTTEGESERADQFQFLIERYNEYAQKHGMATV